MKTLIPCLFVMVAGLVGCAAQDAASPEDEAVEEAELGGPLCCIDYGCPELELEFTGCKAGGGGPGPAFQACRTACGRVCDVGAWICM